MLKNLFRSKRFERQLEPQLAQKISELRPRLYRLASSWCGDAMLADDLVQETLQKAIQKQHQLKEFSRLEAWLYRILHNCWMQYLRAEKPAMDIDDVDLLHDDTPDQQLSEQQIVERVRRAIMMLPLTQKQVITLVDLEGSSYAEVSEILEIPLGTVMSRLNRARALLKLRLSGVRSPRSSQAQTSSKLDSKQNFLRRVK